MKRLLWAGLMGLVALMLVPLAVTTMLTGPPKVPAISQAGAESANCTVAAPKISAGLTAESVEAIAYRAGWRGADLAIAVAVARAESGWKATATNRNSNGSVDYGLFQINSIHAAILASGNWADPADNAAMAFKVWTDAGGKWSPWVTFWSGSYRKFLGATTVKPVCVAPVIQVGKDDGRKYPNGMIPASVLSSLWADRDQRLRGQAATRFDALAKAYAVKFGVKPCITDSYRSYPAQVSVFRRKPGLAAIPGTSNHGEGWALDLCSKGRGQWLPGSDYDLWMHQNAPAFGWVHPDWAHAGGSRPEPWHWECLACGAK